MAVWRIGNGKSLFKEKRSFCDFCKKELKWYDNIPLLSWFFYKGKSRCCKKKLPLLYPVVEITTGLLFLLNYELQITNYEFSILIILDFIILGILMFEAVFDYKYMVLPDVTAYALIILALIKWIIFGMPINYLVSAIVSGLFIFILHKIKIKGQEAMGDGDIFLAFFMGLFLGFPNIIVAFYMAFIVGALIGGVLIFRKKIKRLAPIPFGPFLILGTVIAYFWGEKIVKILNF